ncbi:MAG: Dabb family protein, partial [Cyclobacteriaceae bacterium]|nr:Dabb family protein [Cyclobacteriaceae bacterium]
FQKGLEELVTIETIKTKHLGVPAKTDRDVIDSSYSYSLLLMFDNKADQDIYQTHPTHLKFIEENQQYWKKVVVYDSVDY